MIMTQPAPLRFYVPEPAVRPGGQPDFSNVPIPEVGSVRRPEIDADLESIRDLAFSIIRVLDRNGDAVDPWDYAAPGILGLLGGLRGQDTQ
jgi:2-oxoisovalerate dehydrogenase E1 component alpha subunit